MLFRTASGDPRDYAVGNSFDGQHGCHAEVAMGIDATTTNTVKLLLSARRREVQDDMHARLRDGRTDHARGAGDDIDHADARTRADMDLSLLQMRSDTLTRIDAALVRIDSGEYGSCVECGGTIAEGRLRALPFALRCRDCEDRREQEYLQQVRRAVSVSEVPDAQEMFLSRAGRR